MTGNVPPLFEVRLLEDGTYAVDAIWLDGNVERAPGFYGTPLEAQMWVILHSDAWLKERSTDRQSDFINRRLH
jgi:hypothetical protein